MSFKCVRCGESGDWVNHSPLAGKSFHLHDFDPREIYGYHPDEICKGCHTTLTDNVLLGSDISFNFFYSAASYTSRSVLEAHNEDNILVSYRTQENGRVGPENRHFVDCGGDPQAFSTFDQPEYPSSHTEYLDYIEQTTTGGEDLWTLRDYPCAESVLDKFDSDVSDFQIRTRNAHRELLNKANNRNIRARPVSVLQGTTLEEYLDHAIELREHGVLTDYVAIGGIAGYGPKRQQKLILGVREFLPKRHRLHGLGCNIASLERAGVLNALASADSGNWYNRDADAKQSQEWGWETRNRMNYDTVTYQYLDHRRRKNKLLTDNFWESENNSDEHIQPTEIPEGQETLTTTSEKSNRDNQKARNESDEPEHQVQRSYMHLLSGDIRNTLRKYKQQTDLDEPQRKHRNTQEQTNLNSYNDPTEQPPARS